MIRTKCPQCGKPLGVVDAAAGGVATCPGCKQKFRVPGAKAGAPVAGKTAPAPAAAPKEEFPQVELVEDGEAGGKRRPSARDDDLDDEVVAQRDDSDDEDEGVPRKGFGKKKKGKRGKNAPDPFMKIRNRVMGAVGALAGIFLIGFGIVNTEILNVTAQVRQVNPSLEAVPRIATIVFGAMLVLVGGYYALIDFFRE